MARYTVWTIWCLGISFIAPQAVAAEIGRYQLFQGEYSFVNLKGEEYTQKALFKIDTATGKLFICKSGQYQLNGAVRQISNCLPFDTDLRLPEGTPSNSSN